MNPFCGRLVASIVTAFVAAAPCIVRADVIAHWSFDRTLGDEGMYPDSAGNAHPATPQDKSAVVPYDGKAPFGGAVTFNGSPGSYLNIPLLTSIQKTSFTVAAWVNMTTPGPNFIITDWPSAAQAGFVFGVDSPTGDNSHADPIVDLASNEPNPRRRGTRLSVARIAPPASPVPLKEWHHMAWTWDRGTEVLTAYLDGTSIGQQRRPANNLSKKPDLAPNNHPMRIGSREMPQPNTGSPVNFNGSIDELWIFDSALTADQLNNLIKTNNIDRAPVVASAVPAAGTPEAAATRNPVATPTPTPDNTPDVAPAIIPPRTVTPVDVTPALSSAPARANGGKAVGVIACLLWAISLSSYLAWGIKERARLRAAGKL